MSTRLGTALGTRLGRALGSTQSLFEEILYLAQGRPVFTADYYLLDTSSGKVAAFVDWNDPSHLLQQASAAAQVAAPSLSADFAAKACATFTGLESYVSNRTAASWNFRHNLTSSEERAVFTPTDNTNYNSLHETLSSGSPFGPGARLAYRGQPSSANFLQIYNATTTIINESSTGITINTPTYHGYRCEGGAVWKLIKGTMTSLTVTGSPSSADAATTLIFGRTAGGAFPLKARWAMSWFGPSLKTTERALIENYIRVTYGISP